jgi:hypothetical protein
MFVFRAASASLLIVYCVGACGLAQQTVGLIEAAVFMAATFTMIQLGRDCVVRQ